MISAAPKTQIPLLNSWFAELSDQKGDKTNDQAIQDSLLQSIKLIDDEAKNNNAPPFGDWVEGNQVDIIKAFLTHAKQIKEFHLKLNSNSEQSIGNLSNYIEGIEQLGGFWIDKQRKSVGIGKDIFYLLVRKLRERLDKKLQEGFAHLRAKNKKREDNSTPMFEVNTPAERDFLLLMEKYFLFYVQGSVRYGTLIDLGLKKFKNTFREKLDNYFKKAHEFDTTALPSQAVTASVITPTDTSNTNNIMSKIRDAKELQPAGIKPLSKRKIQQSISSIADSKSDSKPSLKPLRQRRVEPELLMAFLNRAGIFIKEKDLRELIQAEAEKGSQVILSQIGL